MHQSASHLLVKHSAPVCLRAGSPPFLGWLYSTCWVIFDYLLNFSATFVLLSCPSCSLLCGISNILVLMTALWSVNRSGLEWLPLWKFLTIGQIFFFKLLVKCSSLAIPCSSLELFHLKYLWLIITIHRTTIGLTLCLSLCLHLNSLVSCSLLFLNRKFESYSSSLTLTEMKMPVPRQGFEEIRKLQKFKEPGFSFGDS